MVDHLNVKYTYKKRDVFYFTKRVPKDIRSHYIKLLVSFFGKCVQNRTVRSVIALASRS